MVRFSWLETHSNSIANTIVVSPILFHCRTGSCRTSINDARQHRFCISPHILTSRKSNRCMSVSLFGSLILLYLFLVSRMSRFYLMTAVASLRVEHTKRCNGGTGTCGAGFPQGTHIIIHIGLPTYWLQLSSLQIRLIRTTGSHTLRSMDDAADNRSTGIAGVNARRFLRVWLRVTRESSLLLVPAVPCSNLIWAAPVSQTASNCLLLYTRSFQ